MKKLIKKLSIPIAAALLLLNYSCKKWDKDYPTPGYVSNGSLLNIINKNSSYKEFSGLLKKSGYDSVLRRTDLYTVLAIKNGAFAGIDTTNVPLVKRIIGTHIIPTAIYTQGMNNTFFVAVSGKPVYFTQTTGGQAANGFAITATSEKSVNGVIYEIAQAIIPAPNIFEAIQANTNFSFFNSYIISSYVNVPDPSKNSIIGYDTQLNPIYRQPVILMPSSAYLNAAKINDEKTVSTAFIPVNSVVNTVLSRMVQFRGGRTNLVIPRVGTAHNDTIIGGSYFIPKGVAYAGDSSILKDYLFNHVIVRGNIQTLAATNNFIDIAGNPLMVTSAQVTGGVTTASNGAYYTMNDVTLPDEAYRSKFMFVPYTKNAQNGDVATPGIVYTGGTTLTSAAVNNTIGTAPAVIASNYRAFSTRFNFTKIGAKVDFNMPFVTHGHYKVLLKNYLDNNGAVVSANYGSQPLKQNFNTSTLYALAEGVVDVDLGTINVASDGPVDLTFTCAGVSLKSAGQYLFTVDTIILIPVAAP